MAHQNKMKRSCLFINGGTIVVLTHSDLVGIHKRMCMAEQAKLDPKVPIMDGDHQEQSWAEYRMEIVTGNVGGA